MTALEGGKDCFSSPTPLIFGLRKVNGKVPRVIMSCMIPKGTIHLRRLHVLGGGVSPLPTFARARGVLSGAK